MPRGVIIRAAPFDRRVEKYLCVGMRSQRPGEGHGQWQRISRLGYVVLCPSDHEAHEMVRYVGPRAGFAATTGYIDDRWEQWVLGRYLRIEHYGRPSGVAEMLYAEFVRGWVPSEEMLNLGRRASPGITDGVLEPEIEQRHPSFMAAAIRASMGV